MDREIAAGYKQTEVGVIPEDWSLTKLKKLIKIKNGYAFSSAYFSDRGSIVLTPGNFKLDGGLYFNHRNIKRYSGEYPDTFKFEIGDLLVVMTDLTPDCNLLGKPAFVNRKNLLHNQRIGKIFVLSSYLLDNYLYWFFLSEIYCKRMKDTATGSTVRHTSINSICETFIPLPPTKTEQTAIATALSDVDALISGLDNTLAKKRLIKQGAMQELLTGKKRLVGFSGEWKTCKLGDLIINCSSGATPYRGNPDYYKGDVKWITSGELNYNFINDTLEHISSEAVEKTNLKNTQQGHF